MTTKTPGGNSKLPPGDRHSVTDEDGGSDQFISAEELAFES